MICGEPPIVRDVELAGIYRLMVLSIKFNRGVHRRAFPGLFCAVQPTSFAACVVSITLVSITCDKPKQYMTRDCP